jgi:acetyl esterase/lipase
MSDLETDDDDDVLLFPNIQYWVEDASSSSYNSNSNNNNNNNNSSNSSSSNSSSSSTCETPENGCDDACDQKSGEQEPDPAGLKMLDVYVRRDLWQPNDNQRLLPVVVYMHGGAWLLGNKDLANSQSVCHHLAKTGGYLAVSVSYTLTSVSNASLTAAFVLFTAFMGTLGLVSSVDQKAYLLAIWLVLSAVIMIVVFQRDGEDVRHPCHVVDCARAVRWVRDHAADFGGDANSLIVMGHSAGAHLASLLASNPTYLESVGMSPRDISAAVCLSGVYNDRSLNEGGVLARSLLNETFSCDRRLHISAFPIHHADPSVCPPFFLINAWRDVSLKRQTKEFRSVLLQNRVYVDSRVYPHTNHYTIIMEWDSRNHHVLLDIITFIDRCLATTDKTTRVHQKHLTNRSMLN